MGTASLIKSTALTRAGVDALRWWAAEIANARVPEEVRPMLLDAQTIAPSKESTMGAAKSEAEKVANWRTGGPWAAGLCDAGGGVGWAHRPRCASDSFLWY